MSTTRSATKTIGRAGAPPEPVLCSVVFERAALDVAFGPGPPEPTVDDVDVVEWGSAPAPGGLDPVPVAGRAAVVDVTECDPEIPAAGV